MVRIYSWRTAFKIELFKTINGYAFHQERHVKSYFSSCKNPFYNRSQIQRNKIICLNIILVMIFVFKFEVHYGAPTFVISLLKASFTRYLVFKACCDN